jgi:Tfp pilus assembly protein FimT
MSEPTAAPSDGRSYIYWTSLAILIGLVVIALFSFSSAASTRQAQQKAAELSAAIEEAGGQPPSEEQIVRVLGDDGGAVCDDPSAALRRAIFYGQLSNGAAGPGLRPVIADNRAVRGQLLVVETYCPDELEDVRQWVEDLKLDDVAED